MSLGCLILKFIIRILLILILCVLSYLSQVIKGFLSQAYLNGKRLNNKEFNVIENSFKLYSNDLNIGLFFTLCSDREN